MPAALILEKDPDDPEARILQAEARHRLLKGSGIRVFSRPQLLEDWLREHDLSLDDRSDLITDAGRVIPGFTLPANGVEFFVHSPFASRLEDGTLIDRNTDSLVVQGTFQCGETSTKLMITSDVDHVALAAIVNVTRAKHNDDRLEWDVFELPHHCSYLSIGPDKGTNMTTPVAEVKWLYEAQGQRGGVMVSTSWPIPSNDDDKQPPHRQAANYYKKVAGALDGEFKVTMEHPNASAPAPLVINIDEHGATVEKRGGPSITPITGSRAPRAGWYGG